MAYGNLNVDTITGSGASSVIVNNGSANVCGFTTGNNLQMLQNGGGIVFSNSSALTNSTLNDYETGTWTPTDASGAGLTLTNYSGNCYYTKVGRLVTASFILNFPTNSNSSGATIGGLPFTLLSTSASGSNSGSIVYTTYGTPIGIFGVLNSSTFVFYSYSGGQALNSGMSGVSVRGAIIYHAQF